jgi:hypothetical protein
VFTTTSGRLNGRYINAAARATLSYKANAIDHEIICAYLSYYTPMQLRRIKNILQIIDGDEKLPMSLLVDSYTQLNVFQAMLKQQNLDKKKVISHWHYCNISERIEGRIMYYEHIRHKNSQDFLKY